jgi:O-antigen/teichoic acid export membrane protein
MATMATSPAAPLPADAVPASPDMLDSVAAGSAAIRGGAVRIVGYAAGLLISVVSTALLFRHLGRVDTGQYSLAVALVAIVAGLSDLGLTAIGVRELSIRTHEDRDRLARNLLGLRIVLSGLGALAITGFAALAGYGATLVIGVALAGVGLVLQSCQSTLALALISDLRLGWVTAFEFMRAFLTSMLIIALVIGGAHLLAFLSVSIPVGVIVLAMNAWIVRGRIPLKPAFNRSEWWVVIRDVLPFSAAVAAGTLYFYMAVVIVSLLANADQLSYFGVSTRVIQVLIVIPGLVVGAAFPIFSRAARDDRARLAYALERVFEVNLMLGVLVALCLAIGSSIVIRVIGGPQFVPAASVLAIQGIGLGANVCGAVWSYGLLSLGRYRVIMIINLLALLGGALLIAVLVSVDGARGAAMATATAEILLAVSCGFALARVDSSLKPSLRVVPAVVLATSLAVASTLIALPVLASVALAGVIYLLALLALGAVPRELLEQVLR